MPLTTPLTPLEVFGALIPLGIMGALWLAAGTAHAKHMAGRVVDLEHDLRVALRRIDQLEQERCYGSPYRGKRW